MNGIVLCSALMCDYAYTYPFNDEYTARDFLDKYDTKIELYINSDQKVSIDFGDFKEFEIKIRIPL